MARKTKTDELLSETFLSQENTPIDRNSGGVAGGTVSGKKFFWGLAVLVFLAVVYFAAIALGWFRWKSGYQAVFLNNGQVYFGRIYKESSQYPILKNIYYLQVAQSSPSLQNGEEIPANINLIKLGTEIHGPKDEMRINRDSIIFIEDLSPDSRILEAITRLNNSQ